MTDKALSHKLAAMNADIESLEQKIEQVLAICGQLRNDNRTLRDQLSGLEHKNQLLVSRADSARTRLEVLMEKLPTE